MATDEAIPLRADIEWANTTLVFHPVGLAPPVPLAGRIRFLRRIVAEVQQGSGEDLLVYRHRLNYARSEPF